MGRKVIDFYWIPLYLQAGKFTLFVYCVAASSTLFAHSKHHIIAQEASKGLWYNGQFPCYFKKDLLNPRGRGENNPGYETHKINSIFCLFKEREGLLDHLNGPDFSLCTSEHNRAWFGVCSLCGRPRTDLGPRWFNVFFCLLLLVLLNRFKL